MKIISLAEAKALGLKRYFTGKSCKRAGHVAERYVGAGCVECAAAGNAKRYAANPKLMNMRSREYQRAHSEKIRAQKAAAYTENRETVLVDRAAYYAENRETVRTRVLAYRKQRPEKHSALNAKRRALKLAQACTCCTPEQIEDFYITASLYGGEVDHKIPLWLGGKHCHRNLQAMTDTAHREKTKADIRAIADAKLRNKLLKHWPAPVAAAS